VSNDVGANLAKQRESNKGWLETDFKTNSGANFKHGLRILKVETGEGAKDTESSTDNTSNNSTTANSSSNSNGTSNTTSVTMGEPWTPEEFTRESLKAEHPFDVAAEIKDRAKLAAFRMLTEGADATIARRAATMTWWTQRAKDLDQEERALKARAPPEVIACWSRKRTRLFEEMARAAGVPHPELLISYMQERGPYRRGLAAIRAVRPKGDSSYENAQGSIGRREVVEARPRSSPV